MIVFDTNVLSELMRASPEPVVLDWFREQPSTSLFTTAITVGEILCGLALLPTGKRRELLTKAAEQVFAEDLKGRVLPFDRDAARAYGEVAATRRAIGRPISHADAQIAGICISRGAHLATRNTADFDECGLVVVDPFGGVMSDA